MFLGCGGKPAHPEKTHVGKRRTCKLSIERYQQVSPLTRIFLCQGCFFLFQCSIGLDHLTAQKIHDSHLGLQTALQSFEVCWGSLAFCSQLERRGLEQVSDEHSADWLLQVFQLPSAVQSHHFNSLELVPVLVYRYFFLVGKLNL